MTPTETRDRAVALLVAAAQRADGCCARALAGVADEVRVIRIPEAPSPPAEATRRRDVIVRSIERCARLLMRGHAVRPIAVRLGGIAQQIRRLVLAGEQQAEPVRAPPSGRPSSSTPPSGRPDGRYMWIDAETAIGEPRSRRRG